MSGGPRLIPRVTAALTPAHHLSSATVADLRRPPARCLSAAVLLDMCYWVNGLAFLHLFVMPKSSTLFAITFACANGPVAVAIIAWRNSLVFHDLEKVTSVFIHIMVCWRQSQCHFDVGRLRLIARL